MFFSLKNNISPPIIIFSSFCKHQRQSGHSKTSAMAASIALKITLFQKLVEKLSELLLIHCCSVYKFAVADDES